MIIYCNNPQFCSIEMNAKKIILFFLVHTMQRMVEQMSAFDGLKYPSQAASISAVHPKTKICKELHLHILYEPMFFIFFKNVSTSTGSSSGPPYFGYLLGQTDQLRIKPSTDYVVIGLSSAITGFINLNLCYQPILLLIKIS